MRSLHWISLLPLIIVQGYASVLVRRDTNNQCTDLHAASNNGDRKIAIVIDSSGSMAESDPDNLRLTAASNLINNWLISNSKATSKKPADLVTVINFSDEATLDYPLGDPAAANSSLGQIGADGGTLIASGVEMAIAQLTGSGSGSTDKRSGILVFTDGEDSDTPSLVDQINKATGLGIRVSFGFLSESASYQDGDVLAAIMQSGGQYSTVFSADTANSFVNLVLVNGLTTNDNPQGSQSQLLGGLSVSRFISGSDTVSVTYNARDNEIIDFTVDSINAGNLDVQALLNGKVVDEDSTLYSSGDVIVSTKKAGKVEIKVKASSAPNDSIFTVGAVSNLPTQNCTVGVDGGKHGLSPRSQAGLGVGLVAMFGCIGVIGFFLYKHFFPPKGKIPTSNHGEPKYVGDQVPHDMPPDAKIDPHVHTYPLHDNPQVPPVAMASPPYMPPHQPTPPTDQNGKTEGDTPSHQNDSSDQPYQLNNNPTGDQPPNSTSDQPPQTSNPTSDQPPQSNNPTSDNNNNNSPPQQPDQPHDHDMSGSDSSGSDTDSSHNKHKRPKRRKTRKDECSCLQCRDCFDCGSLCTPDCSTASNEGPTGGRDCGPECRMHCEHKDKYDCSTQKAHKKHRHRCHRCRAHNDRKVEGRVEVCECRECEICTGCTSDCGPSGCLPLGDELQAGRGHVHVRHRCGLHMTY